MIANPMNIPANIARTKYSRGRSCSIRVDLIALFRNPSNASTSFIVETSLPFVQHFTMFVHLL